MEQGKCERELRRLTGHDRGYKQTRKMGELREVDNKARHPNNTLFLRVSLICPLLASPAPEGQPLGHTAMPQQSPTKPKTLNPDV